MTTAMPALIRYEVNEHVATITLNRPEALNALGGSMREDLESRLREAAGDKGVRCIVITGAGKAFCAGGDIASMAELQARDDFSVTAKRMATVARIVTLLQEIPKPVIAAVNGAAAGGGMNLALACDFRYAAASARFTESFVKIGLVPDWGGHYLLTRLIGPARALELMMSGERIDADTALGLGLVNHVFADEHFHAQVEARARLFAAGPAAALAAIKRGVYAATTGTLADSLAHELIAQRAAFLSHDAREGMRAFLAKRAPVFGAEE